MEKILVLGYFGYLNNQLDGQTVKTRNVYALLKAHESEMDAQIIYFDTQLFQMSRLNFFQMILKLLKVKSVFYLGAHDNLRYLSPVIILLCRLFRKEVYYIVIGGWLAEFLANKPLHRWLLKRIKAIYPETEFLCNQLRSEYCLNNVHKLNNFRLGDFDSPTGTASYPNSNVRLVFMARVNSMKGVDVVFKLAEKLMLAKVLNVLIDIYGPISHDYEVVFRTKLERYGSLVNYMGVLDPSEIQTRLAGYHLMLFPTKYFTEGFPGSILDAYAAGVPVVVSRWKYAEEFVDHNSSGMICDFNDDDRFIETVIALLDNTDQIETLRSGVLSKARQYTADAAWQVLKASI